YPSDQGWYPLPADHIQDRHTVLAVEAIRPDWRRFLPDWVGLLRLHVRHAGPVHKHERSALQRGCDYFSDWLDLRANHQPDLPAGWVRHLNSGRSAEQR